MKTTVKLNSTSRVNVSPAAKVAGVFFEITTGNGCEVMASILLTPDQAGALIVGLEMAVEANNRKAIAAMRATA